MARPLEATYEQGLLRPLHPLVLPEHQRVSLTLEESPERLIAELSPNERHEELQ